MKLILALPAVGLLFSGLTNIPKPVSAPFLTAKAPDAPEMWVEKADVYRDEAIQLHFSLPHGSNMGVIDPDGKFFYVVFPESCSAGNLRPLVDSEIFSRMNSLTIYPSELKADPYTYGVMENKPVFTKSGVYRFIVGDNLHVDEEQSLNIVHIRYKHRKNPAAKLVKN